MHACRAGRCRPKRRTDAADHQALHETCAAIEVPGRRRPLSDRARTWAMRPRIGTYADRADSTRTGALFLYHNWSFTRTGRSGGLSGSAEGYRVADSSGSTSRRRGVTTTLAELRHGVCRDAPQEDFAETFPVLRRAAGGARAVRRVRREPKACRCSRSSSCCTITSGASEGGASPFLGEGTRSLHQSWYATTSPHGASRPSRAPLPAMRDRLAAAALGRWSHRTDGAAVPARRRRTAISLHRVLHFRHSVARPGDDGSAQSTVPVHDVRTRG